MPQYRAIAGGGLARARLAGPDRALCGGICLGSDLVTRFERLGPELQRYDVFLDALSENARAQLCWRTAERVYGGNRGRAGRLALLSIPAWPGAQTADS